MTQNSALIGYSGFVGGNILKKQKFSAQFNSKNINSIKGSAFDFIICCGAPAVKWLANKEPQKDKDNIDFLISCLKEVRTDYFILISTVDVYPNVIGVNEETTIETDNLHPYGSNRYRLEEFVKSQFEKYLIVRLPGLFGEGLKKNVIYDFMHDNNIDKIDSRGIFQFYNLDYLVDDIEIAKKAGISLLNVSTAPVEVSEIARFCFNRDFDQKLSAPPAKYDFQTIHARAFGKSGPYLYDKEQVLLDIKAFVGDTQ